MELITQKIKKGIKEPRIIEEALTLAEREIKEEKLYPHSVRTGLLLKRMGADRITIVCGLLHHIPEDELSLRNVPEETEREIKLILKKVDQLRELCSSKINFKPKPLQKWEKVLLDQKAENLRRMFFAITQDMRPILVALAGRLDEMKNMLPSYPEETQIKRGVAALEIFAPLAYGLGMGQVKSKLEDLAFPYIYPKEYKWVIENVKEEYSERQKYLAEIKAQLFEILKKDNINVLQVKARAKHYFSLYQKLMRYDMDLGQIYDLVALRIIVQDIESCYKTLGVVHKKWKPMPDRIKDYIASPKKNGYRALHTTVYCHKKRPVEFQIKTPKMHKEAEYGAAAHLRYKEKLDLKTYRHQFYWLDQLRKWKEETKDQNVISQDLRLNLFRNQIFVLTPKREVISLPKKATPVDFAYAVHTEIGEHCAGAKVNGKMVSLKAELKTGDVVEIIIDQNKTPSSDWLRFVKTHKAKVKVRGFLEKAYGISFAKKGKVDAIKEKVALIKKILPAIRREKGPQVLIGGETGISARLSKCCHPQPGDNIQAFITKGEGASLHRTDCPNLKEFKEKWPQRIIEATWKS